MSKRHAKRIRQHIAPTSAAEVFAAVAEGRGLGVAVIDVRDVNHVWAGGGRGGRRFRPWQSGGKWVEVETQ